jgi:hypothetical protein
MKLKIVLAALFFTSSSVSFAATQSSSEFFHRPSSGKNDLQAKYVVGPSGKRTIDEIEYKYSGYILDFNYMYGLSDSMAFGANISTGERKTEDANNNWKDKGFSDVTAKFAGSSDFIMYGAEMALGFSKRKIGSSSADGNRYSGGMALTPYIGLLLSESEMSYGGKMDYTYNFDRKLDATGDPTLSEGNSFSVTGFGEYSFGTSILGLSYKLVSASDYKSTTGSTTRTYKGDLPNVMKVYYTLDIGVATLLADYQMDMWQSINDSNVVGGTNKSSYTASSINFGARFSF